MGGKHVGEEKGESPWGVTGCPETAVARLAFGGIGNAETPLNLMGGDADYPLYQIHFIKTCGYTGGEISKEPGGLTVGGWNKQSECKTSPCSEGNIFPLYLGGNN